MNCMLRGCLIALATAPFVVDARAAAQVFTGRVDVTIEDATGGRVPGVSVELAGPVAQVQISDAQGQAHFLNLPVGTYTLKASLPGFNPYTNSQVEVAAGAATPLTIRLAAAGTAETVTVVAATSVIDLSRETTTTQIPLEELQNIPTARDPWVILQTVPTIYLDRVNVGGSESGQQSQYIGKGAAFSDNTWNLDGVPITDMGAAGSSPTYYDFDMFKSIAITSGGADAHNPTPGVQLNLMLKKGANTPHFNARFYLENERLQATNIPADLVATLGGTGRKGNRIDRLTDYGVEIGGPILRDYWWGWFSLGRMNVRQLTLTSQVDETRLKSNALKLDGQLLTGLRGSFTLLQGNRVKNGRDVSPTRPIETAWNEDSPTDYYKGEGNIVVRNLVASGRVAYIEAKSELVPIGGLDRNMFQDDSLTWHNTYFLQKTDRPQRYAGGDASYFVRGHELKFGYSWRKTPVSSQVVVPGNRIITYWKQYPSLQAVAQHDYALNAVGRYMSGFVTDTISAGRMTVIVGLRHDDQTSSLSGTLVPAVSNFPLLPAVSASPVDDAYAFRSTTPRVGVTYALGDARKTVIRGSYAMFASQLPANAASFISPIQPQTYVYYNAVDRNGNGVADLNEIDFAAGVKGSSNIDLSRPGVFVTANRIGEIHPPRTREILAGVDHEFGVHLAASANVTYRDMDNFLWHPPIGARPADYRQTGVFSGTFPEIDSVSVPVFGITTSQVGRQARNRDGYRRRYVAFEANAAKRMSQRWMGRVGFASAVWSEFFDDPSTSILDPTRTPTSSDQFSSFTESGPLVSGGPIVVAAEGSGKTGIYMLAPKYQIVGSGLYQGPLDINIAANVVVRRGYAEPFFRSRVPAGDSLVPTKNVLLVSSADQFRLDAVKLLDVRVEKLFKFDRTSLALDFDVFNLFNQATVLRRQYDARSTSLGQPLEILNPRTARLGVRFFF
jgi:hypothetical protein